MKYVMEYEREIRFGKEWVGLGVFEQYDLTDNPTPRTEDIKINSFEELKEFAEHTYGMGVGKNLFGKEYVSIQYGFSVSHYYEKDFHKHREFGDGCEIRKVWKAYKPTMEWLIENLSADDFVQYFKDRGWTNINLIMK